MPYDANGDFFIDQEGVALQQDLGKKYNSQQAEVGNQDLYKKYMEQQGPSTTTGGITETSIGPQQATPAINTDPSSYAAASTQTATTPSGSSSVPYGQIASMATNLLSSAMSPKKESTVDEIGAIYKRYYG